MINVIHRNRRIEIFTGYSSTSITTSPQKLAGVDLGNVNAGDLIEISATIYGISDHSSNSQLQLNAYQQDGSAGWVEYPSVYIKHILMIGAYARYSACVSGICEVASPGTLPLTVYIKCSVGVMLNSGLVHTVKRYCNH
jgi:hypothetical protein